jgi:predicted O-methyltransferase YrrM
VSFYYPFKAYLNHWLTAVDEHSIHSPFFFDFYTKVLRGKSDHPFFDEIEHLRTNLLSNSTLVSVVDFGAGANKKKPIKRQLSAIARTSLSSKALAEFYFRIIQSMDAKRIVELGSNLGTTALYLSTKEDAQVFTFEGSPELANVALTNFEFFEKKNIHLIVGNIDNTLLDFLQDPSKIHFALFDANHRAEPTLKYFNQLMRRLHERSIVVIDDIHWSEDMERAWDELRKHPLVYGSCDLFRCGILFFDPALNHQHFIWSFD